MKSRENTANITDIMKKCQRGPQIITSKDAGIIIAETGLRNGMRCLDAGGGSGFMSLFLANVVAPDGKVFTYEKEKRFFDIIKDNAKLCGMEKIISVKNKNAEEFTEKNLDVIVLDMKGAEDMVMKAHTALKKGGFLCVYSPHIEQQKACAEKMRNAGFRNTKTIENIQREWQLGTHSHPHPSGIMHTGFVTIGKK